MHAVTLIPGEWTTVPGTGVMLRWDGPETVSVECLAGGFWYLPPLAEPGRVLLWSALVDRPDLPPWPISPQPIGGRTYTSTA